MVAHSFAKATACKRFAKFAAAGAGGFVVQIATVSLLLQLDVHYLIATAIGVEAAILMNFLVHQQWTWRDRAGATGAAVLERLLKYNGLASLTSVFGSIFLSAYFVEATGLHPLMANVLSVIALSAINFVGADRLVFKAGVILAMVGLASSAYASNGDATLQPKTAREFSSYAAGVESRRAREIASQGPFLEIERQPAAQLARTIASLKRGELIVTTAAARDVSEVAIDGGLINHWRGTVFVPKVRLDQLLKTLQDPNATQHKQEDVISTHIVPRGPDAQKLFLRLKRTKLVTVVYDTEYDVNYKRLTTDRAVSNSVSTKIVEVENAGTPRERKMPEGNDHGYLWRLNSYWRYKQLDDGVLVEIESVSLSRDLPAIIGPMIRPIVSGVARESMARTLSAIRGRFRA